MEGCFPTFQRSRVTHKVSEAAAHLAWAQPFLPEEHQILEPLSLADPGKQEAAEAVALTAHGCTILEV